MTQPLSRRHFLAATAAAGVATQLLTPAVAADAKASPFAPEPPLPAGVCQRLGSARFRELTSDFKFSPDSRWLAQFDGQLFLGYEVASGRRVSWRPDELVHAFGNQVIWAVTTAGQLLAMTPSNGSECTVRRFRLETGRELKAVKVPQCSHATITSDGRGLIQYDGKNLFCADLHPDKAAWKRTVDLTVSDEHQLLVGDKFIAARGQGAVRLFDSATGKDGPKLTPPNGELGQEYFLPHAFSADGRWVCGLVTHGEPYAHAVWDMSTGRPVGAGVFSVTAPDAALSSDGRHLLAPNPDGRLVGVDVRSGKITRKLAAEKVSGLQLSPDGKVLAALHAGQFRGFGGLGGLNNQPVGVVRLLNPDTGELLPISPDPSADVTGVRFTNSHTVVAEVSSGTPGMSHLVWDVHTNRRRAVSCPVPPFQFAGLGGVLLNELSPDATRYISLVNAGNLGGSEACVTDAVTRRRLHTITGYVSGISDSPFWIGRGRIGMVNQDTLIVSELNDRRERILPLNFQTNWRTICRATPDGRTVVISHVEDDKGQSTPCVTWLDVKTGRTSTCRGAEGEPTVSPDGHHVAITYTGVKQPDGQLRIAVLDRTGRWGSFVVLTSSPLFDISPALLSPCGRTAFLAHEKRTGDSDDLLPVVQFWEVASGELRAEFVTAHQANGLGVSPCGRRIATTHRDAPIFLWDVFGEKSDPQPKPTAKAWDELLGKADTAFTAVRQLVQHPAAAVELLSAKLTPVEAPKPEWVKARIEKLGSRDFRTRHTAEVELSAVADVVASELREALAVADTEEAADRLERLVARASGLPGSAIRSVRAIEVLEYCEGKAAGELLKKLAGGAERAVLTREAKAAVRRRG